MTITWQRPQSHHKQQTWSGVGWKKPERQSMQEEAHVTEVNVGPKGSGKSLLSVHRLHAFSQGKVRRPNSICLCDNPECDAVWNVFTNLESPTLPEYGAWAKPLDLASQMIDMESDDRHIVVHIDEANQYFESRRSMLAEVIKLSKQATMFRKKLMRMSLTSISFDWLDLRIRNQANVVYNCWTENKGITTNAIVYNLATGNIPPWQRNNIPPKLKFWYTGASRKLYDTNELVNADAAIQAMRAEPQALIHDPQTGQLTSISMSDILGKILMELAEEGHSTIDTGQLVEEIQARYSLPTTKGYLREWLTDSGFVRDSNGNFILIAGAAV